MASTFVHLLKRNHLRQEFLAETISVSCYIIAINHFHQDCHRPISHKWSAQQIFSFVYSIPIYVNFYLVRTFSWIFGIETYLRLVNFIKSGQFLVKLCCGLVFIKGKSWFRHVNFMGRY